MTEDNKVSGTFNTFQVLSCNQDASLMQQLFSSRRNLCFLPENVIGFSVFFHIPKLPDGFEADF